MQKPTFLFTLLVAFSATGSSAQSSVGALGGASDAAQRVFDQRVQTAPDSIYDVGGDVQAPEFPGGQAAMLNWLKGHVHYPDEALDAKKQGRVFVRFVVRRSGKVEQVEVQRGADPALDAEAVRAIRAMPAWQPGSLHGEAVSTRMALPVSFVLR